VGCDLFGIDDEISISKLQGLSPHTRIDFLLTEG